MPEYRRAKAPGACYFFSVVTFERRPILGTELARDCLRHAWRETRKRYSFMCDAVVVLPDHLHCIWSLPEGDADFSTRWKMLKGLFTRRYLDAGGVSVPRSPSRQQKREAAVWQRRFWEHRLRDTDDFRPHVDYIHFNPVKHGHVTRAIDWRWSSFGRYVAMGWSDPEWGVVEPEEIRVLANVGE